MKFTPKMQSLLLQGCALVALLIVIVLVGGLPPRAWVELFHLRPGTHVAPVLLIEALCLTLSYGLLLFAFIKVFAAFLTPTSATTAAQQTSTPVPAPASAPASLRWGPALTEPPRAILPPPALPLPLSLHDSDETRPLPLSPVPPTSVSEPSQSGPFQPPLPDYAQPTLKEPPPQAESDPLLPENTRQRLEEQLTVILGEGTPLRKVSVNLLQERSRVKREFVAAFLREKKQFALEPTVKTLPSTSIKPTTLQASGRTHPGRMRPNNQDRFLVVEEPEGRNGLFAIADGMGGHEHGELASTLAIETLRALLEPQLADLLESDAEAMLQKAVLTANEAIYDAGNERKEPSTKRMGTTLVAALVCESHAFIANVGDSRAYSFSFQESLLQQITVDHSTTKPNEIYRCLGDTPEVGIDLFTISLESKDILLLCSDGFWKLMAPGEIEDTLRNFHRQPTPLGVLTEMLLNSALQAGGTDNVSLILAQRV